ncbi:MAG: nucleotidyl transferase AbiEii/AbiGii toxin family protein [Dermatophilaceae bacterium]
MTGAPEAVPALARIDLAELRQPGYRVWPLADHIADKLAATFATYGRSNRPSTRVKDLIDLVVLAHCAHVSADDGIAAVRAQASRREIVLRGRFDFPDLDHWSRHYPIEARKVRGLTEQTRGAAASIVRPFVDPILAGSAKASWDPVTLRWRRRP